jgi:hypothetical protein
MVKKASGDPSYVSYVLMKKQIELERSNATVCTEKQAERMLSRSNNILEEVESLAAMF